MTGSVAVHDRIVWGGNNRDTGRFRVGSSGLPGRPIPRLTKDITSELGCVTPTIVVPGRWSDDELQYHAENVATMVAHSASCLCVSAKLLVTRRGWPQRQAFLDRVASVIAQDQSRLREPRRTWQNLEPRGTP
jgi:hypothetical protein